MKGRVPDTELQEVAGWVKSITVEELHVPGIDSHRSLVLLER
jgi:hypothetical protein